MRNDCKKCGSFATKSFDKELEVCDVCYWQEKYRNLNKEYSTLKSCNNCSHEGNKKCETCKRNEVVPISRRGNKDLWLNRFTNKITCRTCGSNDCLECINLSKWVKR